MADRNLIQNVVDTYNERQEAGDEYRQKAKEAGDRIKQTTASKVLRGAISGPIKAINETVETVDDVYDYFAGNPYDNNDLIDIGKLGLEVEGDKEDWTYTIPQAVTQFLLPMGLVGGATRKVITNPWARGAVAGFVTDAVVQDPYEENLFNMLDENPRFASPVTEILKAKTEEEIGVAEARLIQATGGTLTGEIATGVVLGVRALKKAPKAVQERILKRLMNDENTRLVYAASDDIDNLGDEIIPDKPKKISERLRENLKNVAASDARTLKETDKLLKEVSEITGSKQLPDSPRIGTQIPRGETAQSGAVFIERVDKGTGQTGPIQKAFNLPNTYDLAVLELQELNATQLAELGIKKADIAKLTPRKTINLLKKNFDNVRKDLLPGEYRMEGYSESRRKLYKKWFKNDPDVIWVDRQTGAASTIDDEMSIPYLTVKEPTFEEWVKNPPEEYKALFKEIEETSKSADENIARSKQLFKEIQSGLDEQDRLLKEGSQYDQLSPTDQKKVDLEVSLRDEAGSGGAVPPRKPPAGSGADVPPVDPTDPKVQTTFNPKFTGGGDPDVQKLILDGAEENKRLDAEGLWPHKRTLLDMYNSAKKILPKEAIDEARFFNARYGRGGEKDLAATVIKMNELMNKNAQDLHKASTAMSQSLAAGNIEGFNAVRKDLEQQVALLRGIITLNKPMKTIPSQTLAANKIGGGVADTAATIDDLAKRTPKQKAVGQSADLRGVADEGGKQAVEDETLKEILDLAGKGDLKAMKKLRILTNKLQAASGDPEALRRMAQEAWPIKSLRISNEIFINSILSGPETHAVNILSTALNTVARPIELIVGSGNRQQAMRGAKELIYLTQSIGDSLKMAKAAFRIEDNIINPGAMVQDASRFNVRMDGEGTLANIINTFGTIQRLPSRFLLAEDEFFKSMNFRAYVKASAWENGVNKGLDGKQLKTYIQDQFDKTIGIVNEGSMKNTKSIEIAELYEKAQQYLSLIHI